MDIKEFSNQIKAKRKELDELMKRKMPVLAGRMAKDHYQDNFRKSGFVNNGLHPWKKAKDFLQEAKMRPVNTGLYYQAGTTCSAP